MPDPTPTLTDIAAAIRRHSPGAVPESLQIDTCVRLRTCGSVMASDEIDDIARHVLGFAMVIDCKAHRHDGAWVIVREEPFEGGRRRFSQDAFKDSDFGGDPLLSLHAAWRKGKGID